MNIKFCGAARTVTGSNHLLEVADKKYLIDSNIIIYHLNNEPLATTFLMHNIGLCAISQITYIEVLSFNFTKEEEKNVKELLENFKILDINKEISIQAVQNRKQKKIKMADNIIASTSQVNNLGLVTRNTKDFTFLNIELIDPFNIQN